jgi:cytochrome c peroxidase
MRYGRFFSGLVAGAGLCALTACGLQAPGTQMMETETPPDDPLPIEVSSVLSLPAALDNYARIQLPAHFNNDFVRGLDSTPVTNPITDAGATLGRVLFYDTALSANQTISCASCHLQKSAFSDVKGTSTGFAGGQTGRNSMPIIEARYYRPGRFFWDERAATLEDQVLRPIQDSVEMGMTLPALVTRLSAQPYYAPLFKRAFGDEQITAERISLALAQFARSILSYRSRFDVGLAAAGTVAAPFSNLTPEENQGRALFFGRAGCATCHVDSGPPTGAPPANQAVFLILRATNNGLDATSDGGDLGVGGITGLPQDIGRFKSPSLRNIALTAPYMHDGRFATLDEVVEHYNSGVKAHRNLDNRLRVQNGTEPRRLNLTTAEKASLVAFLKTLTDEALLADPKYSNPFRSQQK